MNKLSLIAEPVTMTFVIAKYSSPAQVQEKARREYFLQQKRITYPSQTCTYNR